MPMSSPAFQAIDLAETPSKAPAVPNNVTSQQGSPEETETSTYVMATRTSILTLSRGVDRWVAESNASLATTKSFPQLSWLLRVKS